MLTVTSLSIYVENLIFLEFQVLSAFHSGVEVGRFVSKDRKSQAEIEEFINSLSA